MSAPLDIDKNVWTTFHHNQSNRCWDVSLKTQRMNRQSPTSPTLLGHNIWKIWIFVPNFTEIHAARAEMFQPGPTDQQTNVTIHKDTLLAQLRNLYHISCCINVSIKRSWQQNSLYHISAHSAFVIIRVAVIFRESTELSTDTKRRQSHLSISCQSHSSALNSLCTSDRLKDKWYNAHTQQLHPRSVCWY